MLFGTSSRSLWNKATHSSTIHSHKSDILWSRVSHDFDNVMLWAALCLGFLGLGVRESSLAHATTAARLGVSDPSSRHWDCGSRWHLCCTSELHGRDLHGYYPCLVSRNSLGTTGQLPISYSGCLDICVYILYVWLSFQGAKYTHIWGYEWVGGNGDGGMGCMQNRIGVCGAVRHWRLSVLTFTPLLRSLKRASVVIHLVRVAGIRNSGCHVTYSFRHAGACCQG